MFGFIKKSDSEHFGRRMLEKSWQAGGETSVISIYTYIYVDKIYI